MIVPKRVSNRVQTGLKKYRRILETARSADRSEQDTVTIVTDILADIFGYDKYSEITGEYAIRGTYCDLAISLDEKVVYLIEVKAIDKELKSRHVRQATDYAAKAGIKWVILTNGITWEVYRMEFDQPVRSELAFSFDLLKAGKDVVETIYTLSREGVSKKAIESYHEELQATNRYMLAAVLMSDPILAAARREIRRMNPGVRVDMADLEEVIKIQVIKRDVVEGEEIEAAMRVLRKFQRTRARVKKPRDRPQERVEDPARGGDDGGVRDEKRR